jgi:hypothetical protein
LAKAGKERLDDIENPELAMGRMQQDMNDEWKERGVTSSQDEHQVTD